MSIYKKIKHNRENLIKMIQEGQLVNIDGYEISKKLYDQIIKIDLLNSVKQFPNKVLIAQINKKNVIIDKNFERLKILYRNCKVIIAKEDEFWREIKNVYSKAENLYQSSVQYLKDMK